MPTSRQDLDLTSGLSIIRDTDADATSEANLNTGAATFYMIEVDNSANASQRVYLKLYNAVAPTIGTTAPDWVIPAPGGATVRLAVPEGISMATGISMACVTAGGTGGTTSPTSDVRVLLIIA